MKSIYYTIIENYFCRWRSWNQLCDVTYRFKNEQCLLFVKNLISLALNLPFFFVNVILFLILILIWRCLLHNLMHNNFLTTIIIQKLYSCKSGSMISNLIVNLLFLAAILYRIIWWFLSILCKFMVIVIVSKKIIFFRKLLEYWKFLILYKFIHINKNSF